jgi:hypothetical protein
MIKIFEEIKNIVGGETEKYIKRFFCFPWTSRFVGLSSLRCRSQAIFLICHVYWIDFIFKIITILEVLEHLFLSVLAMTEFDQMHI